MGQCTRKRLENVTDIVLSIIYMSRQFLIYLIGFFLDGIESNYT